MAEDGPRKPIGQVLRDHTDSLMGIPGVVGVGETLHRGKPAILVMVSVRTPELIRRIPRKLEGYPIRIQETGNVRAL